MNLVDATYTQFPFFGTRQMTNFLRSEGYEIKRHQVRSIYERLRLRSLTPCPNTSRPHPEHNIYPYLLRNIDIVKPNQVWSSDITYIRLQRGFVYLMAIIDWFSRYVLDWELSISLDATFCIEALTRALSVSRCEIFNTDQGAQFTSDGFTNLLNMHNIKISMDGKGRALDNVFVERLWRSVKYECIYLREFASVREVKQAIQNYFLFYNNVRPHQSLGGKTPRSVYLNQLLN
jgi:putative transposase